MTHPRRVILRKEVNGAGWLLTLRCGHVVWRPQAGYRWARCEQCTGPSDPTPEQTRVLVALRRWWKKHDRRPSWNEIADATGRTRSSVRGAVTALAVKGLASWEERRPC